MHFVPRIQVIPLITHELEMPVLFVEVDKENATAFDSWCEVSGYHVKQQFR